MLARESANGSAETKTTITLLIWTACRYHVREAMYEAFLKASSEAKF